MRNKTGKQLAVVMGVLLFLMAGCSPAVFPLRGRNREAGTVPDTGSGQAGMDFVTGYAEGDGDRGTESVSAEKIAAAYRDIYDAAVENHTTDSLEVIRSIVDRLGGKGYSAVDSENQTDMVNSERIRRFCGQVEAGEEAETDLIVVVSAVSFVKYAFTAKDGKVEVERSYCMCGKDGVETLSIQRYQACSWVYSEEGYLFFAEYFMPGFDGPSGHTAVRVEPLDEKCRELGRKYLRPVGYELNQLFTVDWSEADFRKLNFYDLYERMRQMKKGQYDVGGFFEEGVSYEIPKAEFESIFQTFFRIDSQILRQYTVYHEEAETYQYRTRGMFDFAPTPNIPYPEVVSWEENRDGTLKLTVNAVWPEKSLGKAFCHEVVIRPLEDGDFQYVSNHMIPAEQDVEVTWYTERLTDEEWQEAYGDLSGKMTPEEEQELQEEAMTAAERCRDFYKNSRISGLQSDYTYVEDFSEEQRRNVVKCLGEQGVVSVSEDMNMENYRRMEEFYSGYLSGSDARITVFSVYSDGNISAKTFVHRREKLQSYYVSIGWQEGGIPEVKDFGVSALKEIKLTEKGYFIYTYAETVMHGNLREYYRVRPLPDECRALTEKYIAGLSYVNYNMLTTDWDAGNVEEILVPVMFEDIYRICEGEFPEPENGMIPSELYERVMTTCFPASTEQIRECCGYLTETDSYAYEMIFPRQFPPFGEVVDYTENEDGTITLYVDGVWPDYNSDCAFTNEIVVQPFADGTFRYLSNSIEQKELEIPIGT